MKNHTTSKGVWLISDKLPRRVLTPDDIAEEAICFGRIDSVPRKKSAARAMIYVSPRKAKSNWSNLNRERAKRMIRAGKMRPAGNAMIALAKKTGSWTALVSAQASVIPGDLKSALAKDPKARVHFQAFPPSSKRIILEWILQARKPVEEYRLSPRTRSSLVR